MSSQSYGRNDAFNITAESLCCRLKVNSDHIVITASAEQGPVVQD